MKAPFCCFPRHIITKQPAIFYKYQLSEFDSLLENEKWLAKRVLSNSEILKHVKTALAKYNDLDPDASILRDMENKNTEDAIRDILMDPNIQKQINSNEDSLDRYEEALATSSKTSNTIILKRHPKDRYMNNYNPEWIFPWDANMDLQLCLDFFK